MSAWVEGVEGETVQDIEKQFEDNFVSPENQKEFEKLEDSDDYLKLLESRLKKIRNDSSVLQQLKEKREECLNNLLNSSQSYRTEQEFELEEEVKSSEIIRQLIPAQAQTIGEIAHLIKHDALDQQKQETEEVEEIEAK